MLKLKITEKISVIQMLPFSIDMLLNRRNVFRSRLVWVYDICPPRHQDIVLPILGACNLGTQI